MKTFSSPRAFTLIELLVVIALIAVLAGGIGLALGRGDGSMAVRNAQGILSSSLSSAKSVAALNQANAGLFVNVDPSSDGFLRELRLGYLASVDDDGDPITPRVNVRIQRGDPIVLPRGVYIVPREGALSTDVSFSGTWTDRKSTAYDSSNVNLKLLNGITNVDGIYHLLVDFDLRGIPGLGAGNRIVLAPAVAQAGEDLLFDRSEALRAVVLSRYGFVNAVNDRSAL